MNKNEDAVENFARFSVMLLSTLPEVYDFAMSGAFPPGHYAKTPIERT